MNLSQLSFFSFLFEEIGYHFGKSLKQDNYTFSIIVLIK